MTSQQPHEEWEEKIIAKLVGDLDPSEFAALDDHLLSCSQCREIMKEYELLAKGMRLIRNDEQDQQALPAMVKLEKEAIQQRILEESHHIVEEAFKSHEALDKRLTPQFIKHKSTLSRQGIPKVSLYDMQALMVLEKTDESPENLLHDILWDIPTLFQSLLVKKLLTLISLLSLLISAATVSFAVIVRPTTGTISPWLVAIVTACIPILAILFHLTLTSKMPRAGEQLKDPLAGTNTHEGTIIVVVKKQLRGTTVTLHRGFDEKRETVYAAANVVESRVGARQVTAAVFPSLIPGDYTVTANSRQLTARVTVPAGTLAEIDWR